MSGIGESRTADRSRRLLLVRGAGAVALGVVVGLGVWSLTRPSDGADVPAATAGPSADDTLGAPDGTAPSVLEPAPDVATGTDPGTDGPGPTSEDGGPAGGQVASGLGANSPGIEMVPDVDPAAAEPGTVGALPSLPALEVAGDTAPAFAVDALVAEFPTEVITLAPSSTVLSSSVSSDGRRLQASVQATDTGSVADVLAYFTDTLGALGFAATESPTTAGSTAVSFTRGPHVVVVNAHPQSGGAVFTVAGVLDEAG
ncbi:MAG: hypothetical protein ACYC1Z_10190 [Georgenia sp.]